MTKREANKLAVGVYRLVWKDGDRDLAAVGKNSDGDSWYAPVNWEAVPSFDWKLILRVEGLRIETERS